MKSEMSASARFPRSLIEERQINTLRVDVELDRIFLDEHWTRIVVSKSFLQIYFTTDVTFTSFTKK